MNPGEQKCASGVLCKLNIRSGRISSRFYRFAVVGALGTLLNLLLMAFMVEVLATGLLTASVLAIELSITHNFLFNNFWTFRRQRSEGFLIKRFLHFNLVSCGSLVINVAVTALLIRIGAWYLLAQAIGIATAFTSNYLLSTRLVFSDSGRSQEAEQLHYKPFS
jgi:dolichol-phosphate mannosyltransferase